jgi:predicted nucleic-acid-binding Zn-ribbon protein
MSEIKRESIDLLLGYNESLSRTEIASILGVSESVARAYKEIIDNYSIITGESLVEPDMDIITENVRLGKQKQKFQDSNRIERKSFREYARVENAVSEYVKELVEIFEQNPYGYGGITHVSINKAVGVIQLSDLHFNELIDIRTNKYDFTIASKRIQKLVYEAKRYFKIHNITDVFVFGSGDFVNSDRRVDEIMAMATNRSKATFIAVQILENMLVDLNQDFNIHMAGVLGNESRVGKDYNWNNEIVSDNYDFTIFNILRYKLKNTKGISFLGLSDRHEEVVEVNGKNFLIIHGHQIGKDVSKDISKLVRKYAQSDVAIDYVIYGHLHEAMMSDTYSRSSSLCGSNSYSEDALLLIGRASQNIFIVFDCDRIDGIKVDLQDTTDYSGYDTSDWQDAYNPKSVQKAMKRETILRITI